jgi:adenosine deaminase/adenosine deaminase CECR1
LCVSFFGAASLAVPSALEPILEDAIAEDFYANTNTMEVLRRNLQQEKFSAINKRGELGAYKQKIMENGR